MFRLSTCLLLVVACHGSNPPAEPEPGATPPIDPDTEPSTLPPEPNSVPPEPNSPSDPQTLSPGVGAVARADSGSVAGPAQVGGMGGMGGFGGMLAGTGGTAPVIRR